MDITKDLTKSCRQARARFHKYLEEQKRAKEKPASDTAKDIITMEIEEVKSMMVLEKSKGSLNKKK